MGTVYEAEDLVRHERVALKTLRSHDPDSLYRFKREFRALSDLSHPNLVVLYELFAGSRDWAFTMELVRGDGLVEWLRPLHDLRPPRRNTDDESTSTRKVVPLPTAAPLPEPPRSHRPPPPLAAPDEARMRDALYQLARGLSALHDAGHVHRDVKPSNVMVTNEGRVVVLDFGVIAELAHGRGRDEAIVGTPAYMAPEQAFPRGDPEPASDWYSFGVVLYELLAGRRPFLGSTSQVLAAKLLVVAPPIADFAPDAPTDLVALCKALLATEPRQRPSAREVLSALAPTRVLAPSAPRLVTAPLALAVAPGSGQGSPGPVPTAGARLIGRRREMVELAAAFASAREGRPRAVLVGGPSGIGKTTLVEALLADPSLRDAVVLKGRCYARESVPYKALDSLVDELARWLTDASPEIVEAAMPEDVAALTAAFPVLRRVVSFDERTKRSPAVRDETKQRAFRALRQVLVALSAHRPLVLFVDDLQWGDLDSAPLFTSLLAGAPGRVTQALRGPEERSARILVLGTFRVEEAEGSPLLGALRESARGSLEEIITEHILAPLSPEGVQSIAREVLGRNADAALLERIAVESAGSPYFALELARHAGVAGASGRDAREARGSLHGLIASRAQDLSVDARRLLETVAVAGAALGRAVVGRASGLEGVGSKPFIELVAAHFLRGAGAERVDTMHDAVREAVLAEMPRDAQQRIHRALAETIEADGGASFDVHRAAVHYYLAFPGVDAAKVVAICSEAGRRAFSTHAYDQAFVHLDRAREVAEHAALPLDAEFHRMCAEAAAGTGQVEAAIRGLSAAIAQAPTDVTRAELRLALSKVYLAQLDTTSSQEEALRGLRELGVRPPSNTPREVSSMIARLASTVALGRALPRNRTPSSEERDILRATARLWFHYGVTAYFKLDRTSQFKALARLTNVAMRLGTSIELVRWYAMCGSFVALMQSRRLAERFNAASERVAAEVGTPAAMAVAMLYRGHGLNFAGDPLAAEKTMRRCLEAYGHVLENVDFHLLASHLAGMLMIRGHARAGMRTIEVGLERASLESGGGRLDNRHTYAGYAAVMLAMLGRADEGRRHLDTFGALIGKSQDRWRRLHWSAHRVTFLVESAAPPEELEEAAAHLRELVARPRDLPVQFRHVYASLARSRLARLDGSSAARRGFLEARADLVEASTHPALRTKLLRIDASFAAKEGDRAVAGARLDEASALAHEVDDRLVLWEIHLERAAAAAALADHGAARAQLTLAESLAIAEGWAPRVAAVVEARLALRDHAGGAIPAGLPGQGGRPPGALGPGGRPG